VDVYEPGPGSQIHDLNPTAFPPTELFWTVEIPPEGVQAHPGDGFAIMKASDVPVLDFGDIGNALFGGGPPAVPATVSFTVKWGGPGERVKIRNEDPVYGGYAGEIIYNSAQMEWTATVGDLSFVSDPLETSVSTFALLGRERNGCFFPQK
jgi:hypothetical protein